MAIKKVNFEIIVKEFVDAINKQLKTESIDMVVGCTLKTQGLIKTLKFYSANTETGDRTILFQKQFDVKNSADFIKSDINYVLYREMFYNCFAYYAMNMDSIVKQRQAEQAIANIEPTIQEPKRGFESDDAILKAIKDAK